jgi:hypothetical protein
MKLIEQDIEEKLLNRIRDVGGYAFVNIDVVWYQVQQHVWSPTEEATHVECVLPIDTLLGYTGSNDESD